MFKRIKRRVSSSGRITIPQEFLRFMKIQNNEEIAICECKQGVMIRSLHKCRDCIVISIVKLDDKGRFIFPRELLKKERKDIIFEIYLEYGELIIREAEEEL